MKHSLLASSMLACFLAMNVANASGLQDDKQFDSLYYEMASKGEKAQPVTESTVQTQGDTEPVQTVQDPAVASSDFSLKLGAYIGDSSGLGYDYGVYVASLIENDSVAYGIDPILAASLFKQESNFRQDAISGAGAIGIAQLMPDTASGLGCDPYSLEDNIRGGVQYLSYQLARFANAGDLQSSFAIAAYNAGPGAVQEYGDVPPYSETRNHVTAIANNYYQIASVVQ